MRFLDAVGSLLHKSCATLSSQALSADQVYRSKVKKLLEEAGRMEEVISEEEIAGSDNYT